MNDFDQLHALTTRAAHGFSSEDLLLLRRVAAELYPTNSVFEEITLTNAKEWLPKLAERISRGSRSLGNLIIVSGDASDRGDHETACREIRNFLASCDMPFYARIAEARLCEYEHRRRG